MKICVLVCVYIHVGEKAVDDRDLVYVKARTIRRIVHWRRFERVGVGTQWKCGS